MSDDAPPKMSRRGLSLRVNGTRIGSAARPVPEKRFGLRTNTTRLEDLVVPRTGDATEPYPWEQ